MKRIILAAAIAAAAVTPLAGQALAADTVGAPSAVAANGGNAELLIKVTGDRRGCAGWYFEWKVRGNRAAGRKWMRYCR